MDVGTTPVLIGSGGTLVQNLGPGTVYIGENVGGTPVDDETGLRLAAGEAVALGAGSAPLYVVSDSTSDVRRLGRASGIFALPAPE